MAPKRGGGGSYGGGDSSSGISVSCPNPFDYSSVYGGGWAPIAYFVLSCLFFIFYLILLISICCVRKRHGNGKQLVGAYFIFSVICNLIGYALDIPATMLRECGTTDWFTYFDWRIVFGIFFNIANYLLLVIFVYVLNMLLRSRLGTAQSIYKVICLSIIGVMGALTCVLIGLLSYNNWTATPEGQRSGAASDGKEMETAKFGLAYWILYMLAVFVSGVLAITSIVSMRNRRFPTGNLLGRTAVLFFCMFFWTILTVVDWSSSFYVSSLELTITTRVAFSYLISFFQLFSYIAIMVLGRSTAWDLVAPIAPDTTTTFTTTTNTNTNSVVYPPAPYPQQPVPPPHQQQQQQYAYGAQNGGQYYYQPQPVYNGGPAPVMNGNGPMAEVKG